MTEAGQRFWGRLTPRQREILPIIVSDGSPLKYFCGGLNLRLDTLKNHAARLNNEAGVSSRLELALFCFYHGVVECPCKER